MATLDPGAFDANANTLFKQANCAVVTPKVLYYSGYFKDYVARTTAGTGNMIDQPECHKGRI